VLARAGRYIIAALLSVVVLAPLSAQPVIATRLVLPVGPARAAWDAANAPVVIVLPDHLGLDERAEFHTAALLESGIAVLLFDLPPERGVTDANRLMPHEPDDPRLAEKLLPILFSRLRSLDAERSGAGRRAVGLLGFGAGGEAAALAAHEAVALTFLPEPDAPRFRAHVVFYPTCRGPMLPAWRRKNARTTGAPVLVVLAHAGGPGDDPDGCGALFDYTDRTRPDPFVVRAYAWMHYAFDLWPAVAALAARRHLPFPGGMDPARLDAASAELARREVAATLVAALRPTSFHSARTGVPTSPPQ
jgi:dienelactone hydrolase